MCHVGIVCPPVRDAIVGFTAHDASKRRVDAIARQWQANDSRGSARIGLPPFSLFRSGGAKKNGGWQWLDYVLTFILWCLFVVGAMELIGWIKR